MWSVLVGLLATHERYVRGSTTFVNHRYVVAAHHIDHIERFDRISDPFHAVLAPGFVEQM